MDRACIWKVTIHGIDNIGAANRRQEARIVADVSLAEAGFGGMTGLGPSSELHATVEGTAPIDRVDLVEAAGRQCRVRRLPPPPIELRFCSGRHKVKVETGWGLKGAHDWQVRAQLVNGRLLSVDPCFRYSEYRGEEQRSCERILDVDDRQVEWMCRSRPNAAGMVGDRTRATLRIRSYARALKLITVGPSPNLSHPHSPQASDPSLRRWKVRDRAIRKYG